MSAIRIASRYAKSLVDLAKEQGKLETVVEDIKTFQGALNNRDLYLMIKSPIINANKKLKIFSAIFDGKIDQLTSEFFKIVIRKGRESYLADIGDHVISQYKKINGITTASVTTAAEIDESQIEKIKSQIISLGLASGTIELNTQVNPDIIGGFVLEIEGMAYDASVKSKLANLKKEILDNTYIKSL